MPLSDCVTDEDCVTELLRDGVGLSVPEGVGSWDFVSVTEGDWLGDAVPDTEGVHVVEPLCV